MGRNQKKKRPNLMELYLWGKKKVNVMSVVFRYPPPLSTGEPLEECHLPRVLGVIVQDRVCRSFAQMQ